MRRETEQGYRRRRKKIHYWPLVFILIALAVIFGLGAFFKVININVTGLERYSEDEIISLSGIEYDDALLFMNRTAAAAKICDELTYVDSIRIERVIPDTVQIIVTESKPIASIQIGTAYWLFDQNGKFLEQTDAAGAASAILVSGIEPEEPEVGQVMHFPTDSVTKFLYMTQVLQQLQENELNGQISTLDMTNISNIQFQYRDTIRVRLGNGDDAEQKIKLFLAAAAQLENGQAGTIDVSKEKEVHFIPD